jgi:hypothetical protein
MRSGDPSTAGLPWSRYDAAGDAHMGFDLPPAMGTHLKREACDFWDTIERTR